jgi:hypothetical protein
MVERTQFTDPQTLWLGDLPYKVKGQVEWDFVNIFSRKINQGDPGPDDHPIYSTWTQRDWSGGGQVARMNPASDSGRFWTSTCETQYTDTIALPPFTYHFPVPADASGTGIMLGDLGDNLYAAWGTRIYRFDPVNMVWIYTDTLALPPTREGQVYVEQSGPNAGRMVMFIPETTSYEVWDGANLIAAQDIGAIEFAQWDQKIFGLDSAGVLYWATEVPTATGQWTKVSQIADGSEARHLVSYLNKQSEATLFVVTDQYVYAVDYANNLFDRSDLEFPRHPHQGRGVANFQNDLYVSVGLGVHEYNGSTITARGLDHNAGVPPEWLGYIVDLKPSYNGMFALIRGAATDTAAVPGSDAYLLDVGPRTGFTVPDQSSNNVLMLWNGFGWHYRWQGTGIPPTNIVVSQAQYFYSVWWGSGGDLYMQRLPRIYFNARNAAAQEMGFAESCEHETPWYDWGWLGADKILKIIELSLEQASSTETVEVQYKLDYDSNPFVSLGQLGVNGKSRFRVGLDLNEPTLPDGTPKTLGEHHNRLKMKFILNRQPGDANYQRSPIIQWHTAECRKWLRPIRSWRFQIDLTDPDGIDGHTNDELREHLYDLAAQEQATVFSFNGEHILVDITNLGGPRVPGDRNQSQYIAVTLIEAFD